MSLYGYVENETRRIVSLTSVSTFSARTPVSEKQQRMNPSDADAITVCQHRAACCWQNMHRKQSTGRQSYTPRRNAAAAAYSGGYARPHRHRARSLVKRDPLITPGPAHIATTIEI